MQYRRNRSQRQVAATNHLAWPREFLCTEIFDRILSSPQFAKSNQLEFVNLWICVLSRDKIISQNVHCRHETICLCDLSPSVFRPLILIFHPSLPSPSPLIPFFFCSCPNFLDELARKRLLCRLIGCVTRSPTGLSHFADMHLAPFEPLNNGMTCLPSHWQVGTFTDSIPLVSAIIFIRPFSHYPMIHLVYPPPPPPPPKKIERKKEKEIRIKIYFHFLLGIAMLTQNFEVYYGQCESGEYVRTGSVRSCRRSSWIILWKPYLKWDFTKFLSFSFRR